MFYVIDDTVLTKNRGSYTDSLSYKALEIVSANTLKLALLKGAEIKALARSGDLLNAVSVSSKGIPHSRCSVISEDTLLLNASKTDGRNSIAAFKLMTSPVQNQFLCNISRHILCVDFYNLLANNAIDTSLGNSGIKVVINKNTQFDRTLRDPYAATSFASCSAVIERACLRKDFNGNLLKISVDCASEQFLIYVLVSQDKGVAFLDGFSITF